MMRALLGLRAVIYDIDLITHNNRGVSVTAGRLLNRMCAVRGGGRLHRLVLLLIVALGGSLLARLRRDGRRADMLLIMMHRQLVLLLELAELAFSSVLNGVHRLATLL